MCEVSSRRAGTPTPSLPYSPAFPRPGLEATKRNHGHVCPPARNWGNLLCRQSCFIGPARDAEASTPPFFHHSLALRLFATPRLVTFSMTNCVSRRPMASTAFVPASCHTLVGIYTRCDTDPGTKVHLRSVPQPQSYRCATSLRALDGISPASFDLGLSLGDVYRKGCYWLRRRPSPLNATRPYSCAPRGLTVEQLCPRWTARSACRVDRFEKVPHKFHHARNELQLSPF